MQDTRQCKTQDTRQCKTQDSARHNTVQDTTQCKTQHSARHKTVQDTRQRMTQDTRQRKTQDNSRHKTTQDTRQCKIQDNARHKTTQDTRQRKTQDNFIYTRYDLQVKNTKYITEWTKLTKYNLTTIKTTINILCIPNNKYNKEKRRKTCFTRTPCDQFVCVQTNFGNDCRSMLNTEQIM